MQADCKHRQAAERRHSGDHLWDRGRALDAAGVDYRPGRGSAARAGRRGIAGIDVIEGAGVEKQRFSPFLFRRFGRLVEQQVLKHLGTVLRTEARADVQTGAIHEQVYDVRPGARAAAMETQALLRG